MRCSAPELHTHLSECLMMLFTLTAKKVKPVVSSNDNAPLLSMISNLLLLASDSYISFSDGQPCHSENRCGFVCCIWLISSTHLVYWTLFRIPPIGTLWMTRAANTLESAAVINVCSHSSIIHSFIIRLFFFPLLLSTDSQMLLNSWYSGPTIVRICQYSSLISMSCDRE